jgi:ribonuclease D
MLDEHHCPPVSDPAMPNPFHDARLDLAMAFMRGRCLSSGIDIPLVASRADIKDFVANGHPPKNNRLLNGWRKEFLGNDLRDLLNGRHAIAIDIKTHLPALIREKE